MEEEVRYFCPASATNVAAESPRDTGCSNFGVCDEETIYSHNPADARVVTGCLYFGGETGRGCSEVTGEGQMSSCYSWSKEEVGNWISDAGFPLYYDCFVRNCITGRRLITVDASSLPSMGVTDFKDIRAIAKLVRDLLRIESIPSDRSISLPPREKRAMFLESKCPTGSRADKLAYDRFNEDWQHIKFAPPLCNQGILSAI